MSDKFTWMHSGQIGAPQMNGAAGSNGQMLQVLDGCLINGFNPQTVTIATKTATTVTLTFGVSHGYELLQIIAVSGATDAALNGQHRITAKTTTTVTINAVGVAVTTGTITTKVAPLDWESIFGSADPLKRAYRSNDMQSSKTVLYLDMTLPAGHGYNATKPAKRAMVSICEDMTTLGTQINSYTNDYNNFTTNPNGTLFWYQCHGVDKGEAVTRASNINWVVIGDGRFFYLIHEWQTYTLTAGTPRRDLFSFGDVDALDGDYGKCAWTGSILPNDDGANVYYATVGSSTGGTPSVDRDGGRVGFFTKSVSDTPSLDSFVFSSSGMASGVNYHGNISGLSGGINNYPNPTTLSIIGIPTYAANSSVLRGIMPSMLTIPQNLGSNTSDLDLLVSGNSVVVGVSSSKFTNNNKVGFFAFNLEG